MLFEAISPALPDRALLGKPPIEGPEAILLERARSNSAGLARADQPAALQRTDVPQERRKRHREVARQITDTRRSLPEAVDHRPPGRIRQRVEEAVQSRRILSHEAKYCDRDHLAQVLSDEAPVQAWPFGAGS